MFPSLHSIADKRENGEQVYKAITKRQFAEAGSMGVYTEMLRSRHFLGAIACS